MRFAKPCLSCILFYLFLLAIPLILWAAPQKRRAGNIRFPALSESRSLFRQPRSFSQLRVFFQHSVKCLCQRRLKSRSL